MKLCSSSCRTILTMPDGGEVGLDWGEKEREPAAVQRDAPILLILTGLTGQPQPLSHTSCLMSHVPYLMSHVPCPIPHVPYLHVRVVYIVYCCMLYIHIHDSMLTPLVLRLQF